MKQPMQIKEIIGGIEFTIQEPTARQGFEALSKCISTDGKVDVYGFGMMMFPKMIVGPVDFNLDTTDLTPVDLMQLASICLNITSGDHEDQSKKK